MEDPREILLGAYRDFNARRLEAVLARMTPDVVWPSGMEGGYVYGHDGVRDYWTRQWAMLDPQVDPVSMQEDDGGRIVVTVRQRVRDLDGKVVVDRVVRHAFSLREGLIRRMDIE